MKSCSGCSLSSGERVRVRASVYTNLPGFKMPCGSRACFTVRCSSRASLETASGHQRFLARPMPCSPVIAPPHAMHPAEQFVQAGFGALLGAGLVVIHHDVGVDVAVAGVAEAGEVQSVFLLQLRGELETNLPICRAARRCPRSISSGRCRGARRKIRGGFARRLRIVRRQSRVRRTTVFVCG